jgi:hypothetical protein
MSYNYAPGLPDGEISREDNLDNEVPFARSIIDGRTPNISNYAIQSATGSPASA